MNAVEAASQAGVPQAWLDEDAAVLTDRQLALAWSREAEKWHTRYCSAVAGSAVLMAAIAVLLCAFAGLAAALIPIPGGLH